LFAFEPTPGSFDHSIQVAKVLFRLVVLGQARPHFTAIGLELTDGFLVCGELIEAREISRGREEEQAQAVVRLGEL